MGDNRESRVKGRVKEGVDKSFNLLTGDAVVADRNHIPMVMKDAIIYKLY